MTSLGTNQAEPLEVTDDEDGIRLDRWFRRHYPDVTNGSLQKWMRSGQIRVEGRRARSGLRLRTGQRVRVPPHAVREGLTSKPRPLRSVSEQEANWLRSRILYIDDRVIAVDKPAGLAVQGGSGTYRHLDGMLEALDYGGGRPRLVHRLDKDTSGVLLLARTVAAAATLAMEFRTGRVRKLYWAIVAGKPPSSAGAIDIPLGKGSHPSGERVGPDDTHGKRALTRYATVAAAGDKAAWLVLRPSTGRTHQLRAHCAAIGCPILGDAKYGGRAAFLPGQGWARKRLHLHARALWFPDGAVQDLVIEAPLPDDLAETYRFFGFDLDRETLERAGWHQRRKHVKSIP